jgi:hypothetical protein
MVVKRFSLYLGLCLWIMFQLLNTLCLVTDSG